MFNTNFNNNFQNNPNQLANYDPYAGMNDMGAYDAQGAPQYSNVPTPQYNPAMDFNNPNTGLGYMQNNNSIPQPMQGQINESALYPYESQSQGSNVNGVDGTQSFASGGRVRRKLVRKSNTSQNDEAVQGLAQMLQAQGQRGDSILAHINPEEAQFLAETSGGDINPKTGLMQFGIENFGKWLESSLGGGLGAIAGNMLLPGIGGIFGGMLGGAAGSAARGRKDYASAGLRGALMGAGLPTAATLAGHGANAIGANNAGTFLGNYGDQNSILTALGLGGSGPMGSTAQNAGSALTLGNALSGGGNAPVYSVGPAPANGNQGAAAPSSFLESLGSKTKNFLSDPANLLTLGGTVAAYAGRPKAPKEKSPERIADEQKRLMRALKLNQAELAEQEAADIAAEQSKRRVQRNKFLPDERWGDTKPLYRRTHTPNEYKSNGGSWLSYYDNPELTGAPIPFKEGGDVPISEGMQNQEPYGLAYFLQGNTGGQDDRRPMMIPEGSFIMDASTVADAGDGNSRAGANKINALVSDGEMVIPPEKVAQFAALGAKNLDKFRTNLRKHKRGGEVKLPPKTKSLAQYLRG